MSIRELIIFDKRNIRIEIDKNVQNENCAALRLGEECGERNPGQLVCGCSNIGLFNVVFLSLLLLLLLLLLLWFFVVVVVGNDGDSGNVLDAIVTT